MDKIKNYLIDNGYNVIYEEHKPYGSYYCGRKKHNKRGFEIELYVTDLKSRTDLCVSIKENHFRGNCNGYVKNIEDITTIVNFITVDN
jgi:hypothetical protein